MAEEVKVPGVGRVPKNAAIAAVAAVAGLIGYYYYNKNKQATAAPAATSTDQYPPDGTVGNPADPYSTDPATGQTYGDEAVGSGGTFGAYGPYGGGGSGSWDPNTGLWTDPNGNTCPNPGPNGYCPGSGSGSNGPPFSNNAAWSAYVIQTLEANDPNQDPGALADAIGLYISGQPVDTSQQQLIFEAIAIGGDPPVAGANGYPPKIQLNGNPGGGGSAVNPVANLKVTKPGTTGIDIGWDPSKGATSYTVKATKGNVTMTGPTSARVGSINPAGHSGASSTVTVLANPAAAGAKPASITITTSK